MPFLSFAASEINSSRDMFFRSSSMDSSTSSKFLTGLFGGRVVFCKFVLTTNSRLNCPQRWIVLENRCSRRSACKNQSLNLNHSCPYALFAGGIPEHSSPLILTNLNQCSSAPISVPLFILFVSFVFFVVAVPVASAGGWPKVLLARHVQMTIIVLHQRVRVP